MSNSKASKKPSAEEIEEKRRQRAEKKRLEAEKKEAGLSEDVHSADGEPLFAPREWVNIKSREGESNGRAGQTIRMISWNILAQGLVRRKLFPGSDCLKWKEREAGLCAEMRSHDWDIAAFQEVDKIEVHGPNLEKSGRRYLYAKGYQAKQHGLMISWRVKSRIDAAGPSRLIFQEEAAGSKIIYFDQECVGSKSEGRKGLSRITRNIALFVALASADDSTKGVIVATTHMFWHPMHSYERIRQAGIIKRTLLGWRQEHTAWRDWPIILAGDFNDQPHSATYNLMTGKPITLHNWEEVMKSSVVHKSVDEAKEREKSAKTEESIANGEVPNSGGEEPEGDEEEEEGEEEDAEVDGEGDEEDDQMLKNCRHALPEDGLLSLGELIQLHDLSRSPPSISQAAQDSTDDKHLIGHQAKAGLTSVYGSYYGLLEKDQEGNYFGSSGRGRERHDDPDWTADTPNPHLGDSTEPMWTLHSTIFALTLDYIFLFPSEPAVTALLPTHTTAVLQPGVPRRGVCASDHVAIGAQLSICS